MYSPCTYTAAHAQSRRPTTCDGCLRLPKIEARDNGMALRSFSRTESSVSERFARSNITFVGSAATPILFFPFNKQHISSNIMSDDEGGGRTRRGGYRIEVVSTNRLAGCKGEHPKLELHQQFIHAHSDIAFVHRSKALQWRVHSASRSVLPVGLITTICDVE